MQLSCESIGGWFSWFWVAFSLLNQETAKPGLQPDVLGAKLKEFICLLSDTTLLCFHRNSLICLHET